MGNHQKKILVTGSSGLIGSQLRPVLEAMGYSTVGMDIRAIDPNEYGDICEASALAEKVKSCDGVIHLAAISRVAEAHRNPKLCLKTNFQASKTLASLAKQAGVKWLIYASSREVYGHVKSIPVSESDGLNPVNVYGEAKLQSEEAIQALADDDFNPSIVRFSNVFGSSNDHATRVIPAFMNAAFRGKELSIEGGENTFDFTFVDEVVKALSLLVNGLEKQKRYQPMHFTTGVGTSLSALADEILTLLDSNSQMLHSTPRDFDVSTFSGNPDKAFQQLGWVHDARPLRYFLKQYAVRLNMLGNQVPHLRANINLASGKYGAHP